MSRWWHTCQIEHEPLAYLKPRAGISKAVDHITCRRLITKQAQARRRHTRRRWPNNGPGLPNLQCLSGRRCPRIGRVCTRRRQTFRHDGAVLDVGGRCQGRISKSLPSTDVRSSMNASVLVSGNMLALAAKQ